MEEQPNGRGSGLFLVRLWFSGSEDGNGDGNGEWSGRAILITSGRACNIVQLATLGSLLLEMLSERQGSAPTASQVITKGE